MHPSSSSTVPAAVSNQQGDSVRCCRAGPLAAPHHSAGEVAIGAAALIAGENCGLLLGVADLYGHAEGRGATPRQVLCTTR